MLLHLSEKSLLGSVMSVEGIAAGAHQWKGKDVVRDSGGLPRSSWRDFLAHVQAGDLINDDFKLICMDSEDNIAEALQGLKEHGIVSAPVWDRKRKGFLGFVDVLDIVCLILDKLPVDEIRPGKNAIRLNISQLRIKDATNISQHNPWCPVYIGKPLLSMMDMFSGGSIHRVPISDEQGTIVSIISQAKVVEFLSGIIPTFGNAANKTVAACFVTKRVECTHLEDRVIDAFSKIKQLRLSGLAVVDNEGVLVGNISASDMKSVVVDNLYADLREPVSVLMKRSAEEFEHPFRALYCYSNDTLQQVLLTFATEQIHRLYIVNEGRQLLGVITLSDIIDVLDRLDLDL